MLLSATAILPVVGSIATPTGLRSSPSPSPGDPITSSGSPPGPNTCTRWLCVSATAILPPRPNATPASPWNSPSPSPGDPITSSGSPPGPNTRTRPPASSATAIRPEWRSIATPRGLPISAPPPRADPITSSSSPPGPNTCTLPPPVSATAIRPEWGSIATPSGRRNSPSPIPGDPIARAAVASGRSSRTLWWPQSETATVPAGPNATPAGASSPASPPPRPSDPNCISNAAPRCGARGAPASPGATSTAPAIHGWSAQWYACVPAAANTRENERPGSTRPLSNAPLGSPGVPPVAVWASASRFVHLTSPPAATETLAGTKHRAAASHPGTDEPSAMATSATGWSANAGPAAAIDDSAAAAITAASAAPRPSVRDRGRASTRGLRAGRIITLACRYRRPGQPPHAARARVPGEAAERRPRRWPRATACRPRPCAGKRDLGGAGRRAVRDALEGSYRAEGRERRECQ